MKLHPSPSRHRNRLQVELLESRCLLATLVGEGEWTEVNPDAAWEARAGLQVVDINDRFYLMGGRTPLDPSVNPGPAPSKIWSDVWASDDRGDSWELVQADADPTHWSARAYFQAVSKDNQIIVLGGQDFQVIANPAPGGDPPFLSVSTFFNDVWSSSDGDTWTELTSDAGWDGRAGLSSVVYQDEIYVMGGSFNDDSAVIGGPPLRVYLNDVWKSADGISWQQVTAAAPWAPRAGAQVVVKDDYMYLLGGEDGFTCDSGDRCPPYYNDVWRSQDGENWELVTEAAEWAPRPGHQVQVVLNQFVLFGGFGLSDDPGDPFKASNPLDVWTSPDGAHWVQVSDSPWNATTPEEVKYDFDTLVVWNEDDFQPDIYTFGGDRETFNFFDPTNYLNVDNDVWQFSPPPCGAPPYGADANVYLQCDVVVGDSDGATFALDTAHYDFHYGSVYVGILVTGSGGLDPAAVEIRDGNGQMVPTKWNRAKLADNQSYVVARLTNDDYEIIVRGKGGSTGVAQVEVSLIGDVDGNRVVNGHDKLAFLHSFGASSSSHRYDPAADATRNGRVGIVDLVYLVHNWSTAVPPIGFESDPAPSVRRGNPLDVDRNGRVDLKDVLTVVNALHGNRPAGLVVDATGDGIDSLQDAILIVRALHEQSRVQQVEAQAAEFASAPSALILLDPQQTIDDLLRGVTDGGQRDLQQITAVATDLALDVLPWGRNAEVESVLHTTLLESLEIVDGPIDGGILDEVLGGLFQ